MAEAAMPCELGALRSALNQLSASERARRLAEIEQDLKTAGDERSIHLLHKVSELRQYFADKQH